MDLTHVFYLSYFELRRGTEQYQGREYRVLLASLFQSYFHVGVPLILMFVYMRAVVGFTVECSCIKEYVR